MGTSGKYSTGDPYFDKKHGVLINKLGIIDPKELELKEGEKLIQAYEQAALSYSETHSFGSNDICALHKLFLKDIYAWAGKYRTVDISSEDIRWCHAAYIEAEMKKYNELLNRLTPFTPDLPKTEILERLAQIHGELVIIHPFRDGNGRITRLVCDLLLMQAGIEPMGKNSLINEPLRKEYHDAIKKVWTDKDYKELIRLLDCLLPAK